MTMRPDPSDVIAAVATATGASIVDLTDSADRRHQPLAFFRQLSMYLVRELCEFSLPETGRVFSRDHTTVLHAVRKVERLALAGDPTTVAVVGEVTARVATLADYPHDFDGVGLCRWCRLKRRSRLLNRDGCPVRRRRSP